MSDVEFPFQVGDEVQSVSSFHHWTNNEPVTIDEIREETFVCHGASGAQFEYAKGGPHIRWVAS